MRRDRTPAVARTCAAALVVALVALAGRERPVAQSTGPQMLDPSLTVETVVAGLTMPIGLAFLGANDMFVHRERHAAG